MQDLGALEVQVAEALALFEHAVPRSELVSQIHLMGHLVAQIKLLGPLRNHWMFPLESLFGVLKRSVRYRKVPEAAILQRYAVCQSLALLQSSFQKQQPSESAEPGWTLSGRSKAVKLSREEISRIRAWTACHDSAYDGLER